jgi:hypothetical protein
MWGAEILVGHQQPDGSWKDGGQHVDHPVLSTSLALLFLKRANLTPDLSKRLLVDPAALTATVAAPKSPSPAPMPKPMEPEIPSFTFPQFPSAPSDEEEPAKQAPKPEAPPTETEQADSEPSDSPAHADEEESSPWRTIIGIIVALVVLGSSALGFWARHRGGASKGSRGKTKGKSAAQRAREMIEDEEDDEDYEEEDEE